MRSLPTHPLPLALALALLLPGAAAAEASADAPATPDTTRYLVLNHGRPAGEMTVTREGTGVTVRYGHVDRNRGRWLENRYQLDGAGWPVMAEARPMTRHGEVGEPNDRFEVAEGEVRWMRGSSAGNASAGPEAAFYRLNGTTGFDDALLVRYLLSQPGGSARILPQGTAHVEIATELTVRGPSGPSRVRYALVHDGGAVPRGTWIDEDAELVATSVGWFITVRPDMVDHLEHLRIAELAYRDRMAETRARPLLEAATPSGPVVIRNGDLFHSPTGELRPGHTVVLEGDRIVAVGPAGQVVEPEGARVIDATGRTIMPGLWDMHVHLQATTQSDGALTMLAAGLTTVRDLVADMDVAVSYRDRVDEGRIVGPRVLLAGFIEGPGEWAGPNDAIAFDDEGARAWIERYHGLGYRQIKLYNLVHPDLVPGIAREAKARGMRLSGHVPRGLSVPAAVRLGFDEINHAAFLFSSFFPDSLYVPEMRPYSGVAAAVAPTFDVDAPEVTEMIEVLRDHGTVVDGTFTLWMGAGALRGEGNPGAENYARMLRRLYEAGVTIVAGTDNTRGSTFVTELAIHELAGIPSPEVLRIATLGAAEVMGEDGDYGSVEVGKVADVLIVEGRPTEGVEALRDVEFVIQAGRVFTPAQLREAAGR